MLLVLERQPEMVAERQQGPHNCLGLRLLKPKHIGLTRRQTLHDIVVPQALRVIVPPLTNQHLNLTKNSSLAAAIAYPDLVSVFAGTVLNQTGQAVEVIAITMAVYLALSLTISALMNLYQWRLTRRGG